MAPATHGNFQRIVHDGYLETLGMPKFAALLSVDDVEAIHAYVINRGQQDKALRETPGWLLVIKTWYYEIISSIMVALMGGSTSSA
jgi:hypothetical protein